MDTHNIDLNYGAPSTAIDDVLVRASARVNGNEVQRFHGGVLGDWFDPAGKEERQLGQQIALMSAEPTIKMNALKAAGINPYTAASGIAGAGSSSTPQPASSTNPIGDVAGAVASLSSGFNSIAGGISILGKLDDEIKNLRGDTKSKLAAAGLDEATTEGVLTDNTYKDEDWQTKLNVQRQQFDNMKAEYQNLLATHEEIMKHIDEMQSQIELNGSQEDYLNQMRLKIEEETRWMKVQNEWRESHKLYITDSGIDGYIFSMVASGADMSTFDNFVNVYSDYRKSVSYAETRGRRDAEIDTAFDKAFNEWLGQNSANAEFAPYFADIDVLKESLKEIYKELVENPGNPFNFVGKVLNLLYQGAASLNSPKDVKSGAGSPPNVSPRTSR